MLRFWIPWSYLGFKQIDIQHHHNHRHSESSSMPTKATLPTRRSSRLNAIQSPEPIAPRKRKQLDLVVGIENSSRQAQNRPLKPLSKRTTVNETSPHKGTKAVAKKDKGKVSETNKEVIKWLTYVDVAVGPDEVETPQDSAKEMSELVHDTFVEDLTCSLCCTTLSFPFTVFCC
jgi:hypothetical protein